MKKYILLVLVGILTTVFYGCDSDTKDVALLQKVVAIPTEPSAVEKIVKSNSYIDIDINDVAKQLATGTRAANTNDLAMTKAAVYRFYSHVRLNADHQYECTLTSAKDINVSQNVFDVLSKNLDDMNKFIKESAKSGQSVEVPEITEDYLSSLLK